MSEGMGWEETGSGGNFSSRMIDNHGEIQRIHIGDI